MEVSTAERVFTYSGVVLPDPTPGRPIEEVRALLATHYPELTTATITGPEIVGNQLRYKFERAVGAKR